MRWISEKLQEEYMYINKMFLDSFQGFDNETTRDEDIINAFDLFIEEHGSKELMAFNNYSKRLGDEDELRDKDGSYIISPDGLYYQEWKNNPDGFVTDENGNRIFYKDGTPVPNIEMPEIIHKFYIDELLEK